MNQKYMKRYRWEIPKMRYFKSLVYYKQKQPANAGCLGYSDEIINLFYQINVIEIGIN